MMYILLGGWGGGGVPQVVYRDDLCQITQERVNW